MDHGSEKRSALTTFDYDALPEKIRSAASRAAERINIRMRKSADDIVEIGRDLAEQKERLGHGNFLKWIDTEFGMSERTAQNFMNVSITFGETANFAVLPKSVLYALSAPSMPPEVRDQTIAEAEAGNTVTVETVEALRLEWDAERRTLQAKIKRQRQKSDISKADETLAVSRVDRLRGENDRLRDERDTFEALLEAEKRKRAPAGNPMKEPQVRRLMDAWDAADDDARKDFLNRISAPVIPLHGKASL
jgi:hypothetical protein